MVRTGITKYTILALSYLTMWLPQLKQSLVRDYAVFHAHIGTSQFLSEVVHLDSPGLS